MKKNDTPQDNICTHRGVKKALYISNDDGSYDIEPSSGWEIEELATMQAVEEFKRLEKEAFEQYIKQEKSPLEVWMYKRRMTLKTLSECTGFWQISIKRDFKYKRFLRLKPSRLAVYADVFDITQSELLDPTKLEQ
ncbi:MAG: hypothetical protein JXQ68_05885 [Campylobacterales bacterium]|nr:hypothetical protein [Campylobacterales bacterium]